MKNSKRVKLKSYIIITFCLILFFVAILFIIYSSLLAPKIKKISKEYVKKEVYSVIYNAIYNDNKIMTDDLFDIYQNSNEEILYVNFNVNKSYNYLKQITNNIKNNIKPINIEVPLFVVSNNPIISNLGPVINIQAKFVNSLSTNVYTKITDYGLNNALVEAYVKIDIDALIITPVNQESQKFTYDLLISSKIINGKVPSLYGGEFLTKSNLLNIPINQ